MDRTQGRSSNFPLMSGQAVAAEPSAVSAPIGFGLKATLVQKMFDEVAFGVLLIDPTGELLFSNRAARELMFGDTGPNLVREMLSQCSPDDLRAWHKATQECLQGKQPMLQVAACPKRMFVFTPIRGEGKDRVGMIMLTVSRAALCEPETLTLFGQLHKLTRSESAVLQALVLGHSAEQIANSRSVTEATIRTHIKNTLHKTGYRSLRQLQAQLAKLPPVRRTLMF